MQDLLAVSHNIRVKQHQQLILTELLSLQCSRVEGEVAETTMAAPEQRMGETVTEQELETIERPEP